MTIPLGVDRRLAHFSVPTLAKATGRSGAIGDYLSSKIKNPEISSSYESFASPQISNLETSSSYKLFESPTEQTTTILLTYSTSIS